MTPTMHKGVMNSRFKIGDKLRSSTSGYGLPENRMDKIFTIERVYEDTRGVSEPYSYGVSDTNFAFFIDVFAETFLHTVNNEEPQEPQNIDDPIQVIITQVVIHRKSVDPLCGEGVIQLSIDDDGVGPFIRVVSFDSGVGNGEITFSMEELDVIHTQSKILMDQFKQ